MTDIAFYYPGHLWRDTDRIKSMLLFFDAVGFLIPSYKEGEPEALDPVLALPLRDAGLLHYFVADDVIDALAAEELAARVGRVIESGALNDLTGKDTAFHALSMSRLGFGGSREVAEALFQRLRVMGLARDSEDGCSIPMHPMVRYLVLVLLAQILREPQAQKGINLAPITDRLEVVNSLAELLNLPSAPSVGRVVQFDLQSISADLSAVPLDEVLDFRRQHLHAHRLYMRNLRKFAHEISGLPPADLQSALEDRQAELNEYAADLKRLSRKAWRKPATVGLTLAGAAWTAIDNPVAALFSLGAIAAAGLGVEPRQVDAYSYLMSIQGSLR